MDIFAKIAAGEIPSYKCAENEEFYAFLDINPLVKGHTAVCQACGYCHQEGIPLQESGSSGVGS